MQTQATRYVLLRCRDCGASIPDQESPAWPGDDMEPECVLCEGRDLEPIAQLVPAALS